MQWRVNDFAKYETFIWNSEQRFNIPANMLAIVLWQASKFEPDHIAGKERNPIGVIGIANLTQDDCVTLWGGVDKRLDPLASIAGAARLLRAQYARFNDWRLAALAYHSDAQWIRDHLQKHKPLPIRAREYTEQLAAHVRLTT